MEVLKKFITENPQVTAAIITAVCSILGIFINIAINIYFRNRDYRTKEKIREIENLEQYYIPLLYQVELLIKALNDIDNKLTLSEIFSGNTAAINAPMIKLLREPILKINNHFESVTYKIQNDFKLFKMHKEIKTKISEIELYMTSNPSKNLEFSRDELLHDLQKLASRIRYYEIALTSTNIFSKFIQWCKYYIKNIKIQ